MVCRFSAVFSHLRLAVLPVWACACSASLPKSQGDSGGRTSVESTPECEVVISQTDPFDGQSDHYWRDPFVFTFSEPDDTAQVLFDRPGTSWWDESGTVLTFQPDQPLEPSASHSVAIDFCRSTPELAFQTSPFGLPISDPSALVGKTWEVQLGSGRFVEGRGIGEPLAGFFNRSVYFQVLGLGPAGLDLRVAMSGTPVDPAGQDTCFATVDLMGLDPSEAPYFTFDVEDFVLGAWEGSLAMLEFSLKGTIAADGSVVGGVGYRTTVPVGQLGALFDITDVAETCALIEEQGVPCEVCPDFSDSACVTVSADRIQANLVEVDLVAVDSAGADCD